MLRSTRRSDNERISFHHRNAAQTGVTEVTSAPPAERENVLGTDHDIPSGADCLRCHIGQSGHDMVNGVSAFQLNHDGPGVTYQALLDEGRIANPFPRTDAVVPGGPDAVAALGYLHANCGYCHRPGGDPSALLSGFFMRLEVGASATVEATTPYTTGVNTPSGFPLTGSVCRFTPGSAATSVAIGRMSTRMAGIQMPPVFTEMVHASGVETVSRWVDSLTVTPATGCTP